MLNNKDGRGSRIPRGQAWQWIYDLQDQDQVDSVLSWAGLRVLFDRLDLLNVYVDHTEITAFKNFEIILSQTPQIIYSRVTKPSRVFDMGLILTSKSNHLTREFFYRSSSSHVGLAT